MNVNQLSLNRSQQIPSFARKVHEKAFPFLDKHKAMDIFLTQNITKRVYCFISRFPFFKLHYNVLHSILGMHRIVCNSPIARERLYLIEDIANMEAKLDLQISKPQENEVESILNVGSVRKFCLIHAELLQTSSTSCRPKFEFHIARRSSPSDVQSSGMWYFEQYIHTNRKEPKMSCSQTGVCQCYSKLSDAKL